MSNDVTLSFQGLAELKDALGKLPEQLKGPATQIVIEAAYSAQREIVAAYPKGPTGKLKRGVQVTVQKIGQFGVAAQVRSRAPHSWLYEHGTTARKTKKGWNRGTMPDAPDVFIPAMVRYRRAMYLKLAELIRSTGLIVTLDA